MNKAEILKTILEEKLVVVIRMPQQDQVAEVIEALVTGGIKVLEVTSNTPGFLDEITKARALYPNILVGAGTITNTALASNAVAAGAQFLVTPNTNIDIVPIAHADNIPVLMGAMTPTEVGTAVNGGADLVKLFPAGKMGIEYFKAIRGPFDSVKFFAVGAIGLENAKAWIDAGALGLGIGGNLTKPIHSPQDFEAIVTLAKQFLKLVG